MDFKVDEETDGYLVCGVCLGNNNDLSNKIMECDGCGATVHEGCYGIQEGVIITSKDSKSDTEPWFCEACSAGVTNPNCELCPELGGVFKETNVRKWVHLVCALYTPDVKFGDADGLNNVSLFDVPGNRWGWQSCQFCNDVNLARTGITIACDSFTCSTYFHVTCGQKQGFISGSLPANIEAEHYYARCMLHSNKDHMTKKQENWEAMQLRAEEMKNIREVDRARKSLDWARNQRALMQYKEHYKRIKGIRPVFERPVKKVHRPLSSSVSFIKAKLEQEKSRLGVDRPLCTSVSFIEARMEHQKSKWGIDLAAFSEIELDIMSVISAASRLHIGAAFSPEFQYYFENRERIGIPKLKRLESSYQLMEQRLKGDRSKLNVASEQVIIDLNERGQRDQTLESNFRLYHEFMQLVIPNYEIPNVTMMVKTPPPSGSASPGIEPPPGDILPIKLVQKCKVCDELDELEHPMVKCDNCRSAFHLKCLQPPLTEMPEETEQVGWKCSECVIRVTSLDEDRDMEKEPAEQVTNMDS